MAQSVVDLIGHVSLQHQSSVAGAPPLSLGQVTEKTSKPSVELLFQE